MQSEPLTTTRLVELAAVMFTVTLGGVPAAMTAEGPSSLSAPFRLLIRTGLGGQYRPMYEAAAAMSDAERREAAEDALDMIIGNLVLPLGTAVTDRRDA